MNSRNFEAVATSKKSVGMLYDIKASSEENGVEVTCVIMVTSWLWHLC